MEEVPLIREQFCISIEYDAERYTCDFISSLESDLQLYNDSEKFIFIQSQRKRTRKILESSGFKINFPLKDIETKLNICLERYFNTNLIFLFTSVEYSNSHITGKKVFNQITKFLMLKSLPWVHGKEQVFDLYRLADFKPLSQHIARARLFLELNRLEAQLKNEKISNTLHILPETIPPKEKLSEDLNSKPINQPSNKTKVPPIFKEGAYDLFCHLKTAYIKDDQSPKAKYSNIYHFLKYNQLLIGTQLAYIDFIESEMNVRMSKILSKKYKYSDTVLPLLSSLKSEFDKKKKWDH